MKNVFTGCGIGCGILLSLLIFLIVLASLFGHNVRTQQAQPTTATMQQVNKTITVDGREITVGQMIINYQSSNMFDKPNGGNTFVVLTMTVRNTGSNDVYYNPLHFALEDQTGAKRTYALIAGIGRKMDMCTLSPGGSVAGQIGFEALKGSSTLKLHYKYNSIDGSDTVLDLQ